MTEPITVTALVEITGSTQPLVSRHVVEDAVLHALEER